MSKAANKYVVPRCKAWHVEGLVPALQPHEVLLVDASDYARLEQECERLRALLKEIRPTIPRDVLELWCADRDAATSAKP